MFADGLSLKPVIGTFNYLSRWLDRSGRISKPGLQEVHRKDRVDLHGGRQIQLVSQQTPSSATP
jgi:hypothetical protein